MAPKINIITRSHIQELFSHQRNHGFRRKYEWAYQSDLIVNDPQIHAVHGSNTYSTTAKSTNSELIYATTPLAPEKLWKHATETISIDFDVYLGQEGLAPQPSVANQYPLVMQLSLADYEHVPTSFFEGKKTFVLFPFIMPFQIAPCYYSTKD